MNISTFNDNQVLKQAEIQIRKNSREKFEEKYGGCTWNAERRELSLEKTKKISEETLADPIKKQT